MRKAITWVCDITCDIRLHSVSDFYELLPYSFTRMARGGDGNFPKYQVNHYDFELLSASDAQN